MRADQEERDDSRVLYELCSMMVHALNFPIPTTLPFRCSSPAAAAASTSRPLLSADQFSPAVFGSLFLVVSLTLMLFGSVTFAIGLILAPWIVLFVLFFYVAGIVSNLSELARAIVCSTLSEEKEPHPWISSDGRLREEQWSAGDGELPLRG